MSTVQTLPRAEKPAAGARRRRPVPATRWPRHYRPQSRYDELRDEVDDLRCEATTLRGRLDGYAVFFRALGTLDDNPAEVAAAVNRPHFTVYQGGAA